MTSDPALYSGVCVYVHLWEIIIFIYIHIFLLIDFVTRKPLKPPFILIHIIMEGKHLRIESEKKKFSLRFQKVSSVSFSFLFKENHI